MTCVCGHLLEEHRPTKMSEPITGGVMTIPTNAYHNGGFNDHPSATYDSVECHCGCNTYEEDHAA